MAHANCLAGPVRALAPNPLQRDPLTHRGKHGIQTVVLPDQFCEGLAGIMVAMSHNDAGSAGSDGREPYQQVGLPRMGAESPQYVHRRVHGDLLPMDSDLRHTFHQHSTQGAVVWGWVWKIQDLSGDLCLQVRSNGSTHAGYLGGLGGSAF